MVVYFESHSRFDTDNIVVIMMNKHYLANVQASAK